MLGRGLQVMSWLISIPIWGDKYVQTFCERAAPALLQACLKLPEPVKFVIHTDQPDRIYKALVGPPIDFKPVPNKPTYVALQNGHADAVRSAKPGDRIVLTNADLVFSGNLLARCAEHFAAGKQAVVLLGIRTNLTAPQPPAGAKPRGLLAWAWENRHQIIRDLEWPHGGSMLPTNLFWQAGSSVVARGFHLHPIAVVKHEGLDFQSTIDGDLLDRFPRESIHVVTDPDDCSMLEMSDPARRFPVRGHHFTPQLVAGAMRTRASETHRWLFEHRIGVLGNASDVTTDTGVADQILNMLGGSSDAVRQPQRGKDPGPLRGRIP